MNKKNILLTGFNSTETKILKKILETCYLKNYNIKMKFKKNFDALVSKNRNSFNSFYFNDFEKLKKN